MKLEEDPRWPYARQYIERGWPIFVLGQKKTPLPNCDACHRADWTHDREACECLTCHGFYAATTDPERIVKMMVQHPGLLALRCGKKSRVLVLDFEASAEPGEPSGLEIEQQWRMWANVEWDLSPTLTAYTASGGRHLFYLYPDGVHIPMRNRILPSTDLKAEHGYVALPCGLDDRRWTNWLTYPGLPQEDLTKLPPEAVDWLRNARGRRTGRTSDVQSERPQGYSFLECIARGPRRGERDEFWNDFLFRSRKARREAEDVREACWQLWEQWQLGEGKDPFPFEWIEYKIDRVWSTVAPDELNEQQKAYAQRMRQLQEAGEASVPTLDEHRQKFVTWGKTSVVPGIVRKPL